MKQPSAHFRVFNNRFRLWLVSVLLILPAMLPYVTHYCREDGRIPTGFIQGDQPYYSANAREHFDSGSFSLFYGNPCDPDPGTPRIYLQPHILLLGFATHATGLDPGMVYILFGLIGALVCARVALALYMSLVGLDTAGQWLGLVLFFWGGGLLVLAGSAVSLFYALYGAPISIKGIFQFDPSFGWWFLNFGRNLILPTEAYYHALFFGIILFIIRKRFVGALVTAAVLSFSHPYTGLELLGILLAWSIMETFLKRKDGIPAYFAVGTALLTAIHFFYYMMYLPGFPAHKLLMIQWTQPWNLTPESLLPAYALVGTFAILKLTGNEQRKAFFSQSVNRLLVCWFVVAFLLANHHYFVRSMQPLHFTRGYIWTSLFLIGAPLLVARLNAWNLREGVWRRLAVHVCVFLFLLDNVAWISVMSFTQYRGDVRLTADQGEVLRWLSAAAENGILLLSEDERIAYLSTVYTKGRSWYSHPYNTPEAGRRKNELQEFLLHGKVMKEWNSREVIVLRQRQSATHVLAHEQMQVSDSLTNESYAVYKGRFSE